MMQFIRMPIEDIFTSSLENASERGRNAEADAVPFSGSPNPVMSQVWRLYAWVQALS